MTLGGLFGFRESLGSGAVISLSVLAVLEVLASSDAPVLPDVLALAECR
ncbi:hypothetical protein GCM10009849_28180 [Sinomonas flava]|uniref:Uncharacterized protein n=1 Tax=Sinomonas flava TaxID=496857 RepID=A0ABN3BYH8_9MICC